MKERKKKEGGEGGGGKEGRKKERKKGRKKERIKEGRKEGRKGVYLFKNGNQGKSMLKWEPKHKKEWELLV